MKIPEGKQLVFFDGVCNLCNGSIQYIIKHDKKDLFRYAPLQGEIGQKFIKDRKIDTSKVDSIILYEPNIAYYTKSTAVLKIGKTFGGGFKLLGVFALIPGPVRDWFYDLIAKNRYKWFGKQNECMIPTAELKAKFID